MWAPSCMICSQVLFGLFPRKIQWMLSVLIIFMSVIKLQSLDWGQDDTTDSTNIWTESRKSYHSRCAHVERQSKIPPTDSTNIWTESWKSYHSRCAHVERQSKIPPTFYRQQEPSDIERRDMAITNNTQGEALWTRGCPTEDHQIRSGNWTPSVMVNKKKKIIFIIVHISIKIQYYKHLNSYIQMSFLNCLRHCICWANEISTSYLQKLVLGERQLAAACNKQYHSTLPIIFLFFVTMLIFTCKHISVPTSNLHHVLFV